MTGIIAKQQEMYAKVMAYSVSEREKECLSRRSDFAITHIIKEKIEIVDGKPVVVKIPSLLAMWTFKKKKYGLQTTGRSDLIRDRLVRSCLLSMLYLDAGL